MRPPFRRRVAVHLGVARFPARHHSWLLEWLAPEELNRRRHAMVVATWQTLPLFAVLGIGILVMAVEGSILVALLLALAVGPLIMVIAVPMRTAHTARRSLLRIHGLEPDGSASPQPRWEGRLSDRWFTPAMGLVALGSTILMVLAFLWAVRVSDEDGARESPADATTIYGADPATNVERDCLTFAPHVDIDGDAIADLAGIVNREPGKLVLVACTSSGARAELPIRGMGEILAFADPDKDGVHDVVYGSTTVSAAFRHIAVLSNGVLVPVVFGAHELMLVTGGTGEYSGADGWSQINWGGCGDTDGDGIAEYQQVRVQRDGDQFRWETTGFAIDGSIARTTGSTTGTSPERGDISDFAASLTENCFLEPRTLPD